MSQYHFTPQRYLTLMREAIPVYDEFEDAIAAATTGVSVKRVLDLGAGTGETARRVLDIHPRAALTALDVSTEMLDLLPAAVPPERIEQLVVRSIEEPLPPGRFELIVSALAVHHLDDPGKSTLFGRIADTLAPGGRFVLGDVIIPVRTEDAVTPLSPEYDQPTTEERLLELLAAAGFRPSVEWTWRDLVVIAATG